MNQKGFTVIEMTVIGAIIGILTAIAIPNFQVWVASQRLRDSVAQLEGDLQVARITAINRNAPVTVLFDQATRSYTIFIDDGTGVGGVARNLVQDGTEISLLDNPPRILNSGIAFSEINMTANAILFNGKGLRWRPLADPVQAELNNGQNKSYCVNVTLVGDVNVVNAAC